MSDEDITPPHGMPIASAEPQPARERPHPTAPQPRAADPKWWADLDEKMNIEHVIAEVGMFRRYREPWNAPGFAAHRRNLRVAKVILLEALDTDPADRLATAYLALINRALEHHA